MTNGETAEKAQEPVRGDHDRAARLIADAEGTARSITHEYTKASMLHYVAQALAATHPDRAEHIAQSITDESAKARPARPVDRR